MNHERTADDYIFIVTHAQFIHYFVEANIIGARCRTRYRRRKAFVRDGIVSGVTEMHHCIQQSQNPAKKIRLIRLKRCILFRNLLKYLGKSFYQIENAIIYYIERQNS